MILAIEPQTNYAKVFSKYLTLVFNSIICKHNGKSDTPSYMNSNSVVPLLLIKTNYNLPIISRFDTKLFSEITLIECQAQFLDRI